MALRSGARPPDRMADGARAADRHDPSRRNDRASDRARWSKDVPIELPPTRSATVPHGTRAGAGRQWERPPSGWLAPSIGLTPSRAVGYCRIMSCGLRRVVCAALLAFLAGGAGVDAARASAAVPRACCPASRDAAAPATVPCDAFLPLPCCRAPAIPTSAAPATPPVLMAAAPAPTPTHRTAHAIPPADALRAPPLRLSVVLQL
jgi:hypothetical protein